MLPGGFLLLMVLWPLTISAQSSRRYQLPSGKSASDIQPNQLIIKFKDGSYSTGGRTLQAAPDIAPSTIGQKIPIKELKSLDPASNSNARTLQQPSKYLANMYKVELAEGQVLETINELLQYENVLYAEPVFKEQLFLIPNDPDAATANSKQPNLSSIKAYDAWGITTGDSTVIIGIIDTGADYTHEDLSQNIYLNTNDPIDGVDNDGNGYVDDYRGWDFANRDSDPKSDFGDHGTHVSGLSSARTNNAKGMAGTGFKSKFVPLKAFKTEDNTSFGNYEAIIYAANQGMDVINLSWGSTGNYSQAAQDIINYAVLERDVVVVAAAGNTNAELTFYPASYDNVLSVAASTNDGTKSSFATYSHYVDLVAPGTAAYSTRNNSTYGTADGSSFSSPQVAGAAALVRSYFPKYSAVQIMEQLRVTGTSVDGLAGNASYKGLLGRGMLNMYSALTDTLSPSVRLVKDSLYAQAGQKVFFGDTVHYELEAINWLKPASGLEISLESQSNLVTLSNNTWVTPYLATFDTTTYTFSAILDENAPPNSRVIFKAKIKASGYSDTQYFEFTTQPDSTTISSANLSLTINSKGDLGYTKDSLKAGNGLKFQNIRVVSHAGFLVGNSRTSLADNVANNLIYGTRNNDFSVNKHLKLFGGTVVDNYYENSFTASLSETLSTLIEQKTLSWDSLDDRNFLITEYRITNTSPDLIENLHAGLFTNWRINNGENNRTEWVDSLKLGVTYIDEENAYGGIALLTPHVPTFYAADIDDLNGNIAVTKSLLTDSLKFAWLSSDMAKTTAGQSGAGNNTAQMNGVKIGQLPGYQSEKVAFAWITAESKNGLITAVQRARLRYSEFQNNPRTISTVLACKDSPATISLSGGTSFDFFSDVTGSEDLLFQGNNYVADNITPPATVYVRNTDKNYSGDVYSVKIGVDSINANFSFSMDPILLETDYVPTIKLTPESKEAVNWQWDLGNGSNSTLETPNTKYFKTGTYNVSLTTKSKGGCVANLVKSVLVANTGNRPVIGPVAVCANTPATIQAANATKIKVYTDSTSQAAVFEGAVFTSGLLDKDTSFYVSNADSLFESRKVLVSVQLNQPMVDFTYLPDTTQFESAILLVNQSSNATGYQWYLADSLIGDTVNSQLILGEQTEITIRVLASNEQGCTSSVSKLLSFTKSALPIVSDSPVCPGENFTLVPENGSNFLFTSANTGEPLHKGSRFDILNVTDTVKLIVKGIDSIIESDPVEVSIYPYDFSADFVIEPAVLILKKQRTATFTSLSPGATSWEWMINGSLIDISQQPLLAFDSAGIYDVMLIAHNEEGCADSVSMAYQVLEVTGVETAADVFNLFPNPASETIAIELLKQQNDAVISIINMAGQEVLGRSLDTSSGQSVEIAIGLLPKGVYTIRLSTPSQSWQQRLIKK
jgi:subtilisin family serine protease